MHEINEIFLVCTHLEQYACVHITRFLIPGSMLFRDSDHNYPVGWDVQIAWNVSRAKISGGLGLQSGFFCLRRWTLVAVAQNPPCVRLWRHITRHGLYGACKRWVPSSKLLTTISLLRWLTVCHRHLRVAVPFGDVNQAIKRLAVVTQGLWNCALLEGDWCRGVCGEQFL